MCLTTHFRVSILLCICRTAYPSVGVSAKHYLQDEVRNHTGKTHSTDDPESHEILRCINVREQIGPVNLRQISHGVNNCQTDSSDLVIHRPESRRRIRQRQRVRRPQRTRHDDKQCIPRVEVIHGARDDTADHCDGHPHRQRETTVLRNTVHEDAVEEGAHERGDVDRDGHVLRHGAGVSKTLDECRIEVRQG